jgi:hypothetical protein
MPLRGPQYRMWHSSVWGSLCRIGHSSVWSSKCRMWHSSVWSPHYRMRHSSLRVSHCRLQHVWVHIPRQHTDVMRPVGARACLSDLVMFWAWLVCWQSRVEQNRLGTNWSVTALTLPPCLKSIRLDRQTRERKEGRPQFFTPSHSQNISPSVRYRHHSYMQQSLSEKLPVIYLVKIYHESRKLIAVFTRVGVEPV